MEGAEEIDFDHLAPVRRIGRDDGCGVHDPGAVDQDVVTEVVADLPDHAFAHVKRTLERGCPGAALVPRGRSGADQLRDVFAGDLDAGLVREPADHPDLCQQLVHREPRGIAVPAGHPLARRDSVHLAEFADEPFVTFPRVTSPIYFDRTQQLLSEYGYHPRRILTSEDPSTVLSMVSVGLGVSLRPRHQVQHRPDLAWLRIADCDIVVETVLLWHRHKASVLVNDLTALLRQKPHRSVTQTGIDKSKGSGVRTVLPLFGQ